MGMGIAGSEPCAAGRFLGVMSTRVRERFDADNRKRLTLTEGGMVVLTAGLQSLSAQMTGPMAALEFKLAGLL